MKRVFSILLLGLFFVSSLFGQMLTRRYATQQVDRELRVKNPEIIKEKEKLEAYNKEFKLQNKFSTYTIPVVFHIVYKKGQIIPSIEHIMAQLESLNCNSGNFRE